MIQAGSQPGQALIGRSRELDQLAAGLQFAEAGRGAAFLVSGAGGIGKSRLAYELEAIALGRGFSVHWGRSWESGGAPAFWPWRQVLLAALKVVESRPTAVDDRSIETINRYFLRLPSSAAAPEIAPPSDSVADRFSLFDLIADVFKGLAALRPLLIILDDLHEADLESLRLTRFLVREFRQSRILLVANSRDVEGRANSQAGQVFGQLRRDLATVELGGLSVEALSQLMAEGGVGVEDPALVATLAAVTGGNPFFVKEILSLYARRGRPLQADDLAPGALSIPESVRGVIRSKLDLLSPRTRETLKCAALMGRNLDAAILRRVCGLSREELVAELDEASALQLLGPAPGPERRLRFVHFLIAEAIVADLPHAEKQRMHARIAEAIEAAGGFADIARLSEIAHHHCASLPMGSVDSAVATAGRAAASAMQGLAYEEAARLYAMALEAEEHSEEPHQQRVADLLVNLGQAQCLAQQYEKFKATFIRAAEIARNLGDAQLFGRAVLGIAMMGNYEAPDPVMVGWLEEAVATSGREDSGLRAALLARLAEEILRSGSGKRADTLLDESITLARRINDPTALVQSLYVKLHSRRGPAQAQERAALGEEMLSFIEERALRHWILRVRYHRAATFLETARIAEFYGELEAIRQIPVGLRLGTEGLSFAEIDDILATLVALIEGRIADAEALAMRAFASGRRRPNNTAAQIFSLQITTIRREQGRLGELEAQFAAHVAKNPAHALGRALLAFCASQMGRTQQAAAELRRLAHNELIAIPQDFVWLATMAYLAETCAAVGDAAVAEALYKALRPYEDRHVAVGCMSYLGSCHHYLGLLATTLLDVEGARRHFESAIASYQEVGARAWAARTEYHYARMSLSLAKSDQGQGFALLQNARGEAVDLGLHNLRDLIDGAIVEFGAHSSSGNTVDGRPNPRLPKAGLERRRMLATILFVDIVGSTRRAAELGDQRWGDLLDSFYAQVRRAIRKFHGREIATLGDGYLAIFDQPSEAIACAFEMRSAVSSLGLDVRSGLHSGEFDFVGDDIRGLAVHIGSRIAGSALAGEVMVSSTVKELAAGYRFGMEDRGAHVLKGVPGEWRLFAAAPAPTKAELT